MKKKNFALVTAEINKKNVFRFYLLNVFISKIVVLNLFNYHNTIYLN